MLVNIFNLSQTSEHLINNIRISYQTDFEYTIEGSKNTNKLDIILLIKHELHEKYKSQINTKPYVTLNKKLIEDINNEKIFKLALISNKASKQGIRINKNTSINNIKKIYKIKYN